MAKIIVSNITAWAPGVTSNEQWKKWARDEISILLEKDAPKLEYTDSLFRRRLSQISKMTIQVVHDLIENSNCNKNIKQVFISNRGELNREFQVSKTLVTDKMILPASFSLSVFNTPIALASIALKLEGGYSVVFASKGNFSFSFQSAASPVISKSEKEIMLVYADELPPKEYEKLHTETFEPFAFACLLSLEKDGKLIEDINNVPHSPKEFLKQIILGDKLF